MSQNSKNGYIYKIAVSAIMIALSTVLSMVKVWQMPMGGSITLLSMLPVCMIGILFGTATAILPCVLYGAIQMMLDGVFGWGLTAGTLVGSIVFDYLLAFGLLCLSGLFRSKGDVGIIAGVAIAVFARFCSHLVSGSIFFQSFDIFNNPFLYSVAYNGTYMLPELVITVLGAFALAKLGVYKRVNALGARFSK